MLLYIIRHAQSTNNALEDSSQRVCDPELTDLGRRQARLLAAYLAEGSTWRRFDGRETGAYRQGFGIGRLLVSPMRRALQTAKPVARALGLTPEVCIDLHERGGIFLDHGPEAGIVGYPGLTRAEMAAELPGCVLPAGVTERGWWSGGREGRAGAELRAARLAALLRQWAPGEASVALITHGDLIDALLKALLQPVLGQELYFFQHNTAVSRLDLGADGSLEVGYLNRTDHLPSELL